MIKKRNIANLSLNRLGHLLVVRAWEVERYAFADARGDCYGLCAFFDQLLRTDHSSFAWATSTADHANDLALSQLSKAAFAMSGTAQTGGNADRK